MASASSFPCEDQFLCSVCLQVFTDPVTTPCGHNYCKTCITQYWDSCDLIQCPLCKEGFNSRPQLWVNTGFRDMVEHFGKMRMNGEDEIFVKPDEVPCDICVMPKLKAHKTCLVCKVSYCRLHLEPHWRIKRLKKHKLTDPVSKTERVCKKHGEMMNIFCCKDQVCVCFKCMMDDHMTHNVIPLEEAYKEKRNYIESMAAYATIMENSKTKMVEETKHSFIQKKKESDQEISDIRDTFRGLEATLLKNQVKLLELIQDEQKIVENHTEAFIRHHEGDAAELKKIRMKMEQALQTEDHFHFLQNIPVFDFIERQIGFNMTRPRYLEMVKKSVTRIEKTLTKETERLMHEVRSSNGHMAANQTDGCMNDVWDAPEDKLMMIQQRDAVNVTFDPYTAHVRLLVSEDWKQLTVREFGQFNFYAIMGRHFLHQRFVLAAEGFSSGRFYYEVQVSGCKAWLLGVVKESIKKDTWSLPMPEEGGWTLTYIQQSEQFIPNHSTQYLRQRPRKVGVFVDYEKGEVSFYDVDARALIYSFTECAFTETIPALKATFYAMAGYSTSGRSKLYPIFGLFDEDSEERLIITNVSGAAQRHAP